MFPSCFRNTETCGFVLCLYYIIESRIVQQSEVRNTLRWPSLEARRNYQISLLVFKCLHGLAPVYLLNQFSFSRDFRTYNTRHKDQIRLPLAKTSKFQSSFLYNGAKVWNTLPAYLRSITSLTNFKTKLKQYLCK